ncbi:MAG: hypothetical protein ACKO67_07655 [Bacteroidota bacterium]
MKRAILPFIFLAFSILQSCTVAKRYHSSGFNLSWSTNRLPANHTINRVKYHSVEPTKSEQTITFSEKQPSSLTFHDELPIFEVPQKSISNSIPARFHSNRSPILKIGSTISSRKPLVDSTQRKKFKHEVKLALKSGLAATVIGGGWLTIFGTTSENMTIPFIDILAFLLLLAGISSLFYALLGLLLLAIFSRLKSKKKIKF